MGESLKVLDVTSVAEDNDQLKLLYLNETKYQSCSLQGENWLIATPPAMVRGPYDHITAIVINMNSGAGRVDIMLANNYINHHETRADEQKKASMIFLKPGYYCWWMGKAAVKFINRDD